MKRNKKLTAFILIFSLIFNIIPSSIVRASDDISTSDINIISKTSISVEDAKNWARAKGATETFIGLADLYWKYSSSNGNVNPAIAYVQAAKETGYGKFGGVINESYFNPCGMKNNGGGGDYDANAHYVFKNWDEGVQAQLDHLALYAGAQGYPRTGNTPDPRHFPTILGKSPTVASLGGKWAPSTSYGTDILKMYDGLQSEVKPIGDINTPSANYNEFTNSLYVKGWALNASGVKEVKVYINNQLMGNANLGLARPDVAGIYPTYPNTGTSGFDLTVDVSNIQDGNNTLKVEQVGKNGSIKVLTRNFSKYVLKTLGDINEPIVNTTVLGSSLYVRGWALNPSGIKEVRVYVDGKLKGNADLGLRRDDVKSVYPYYKDAEKSGYELTVDMKDISVGSKVVTVEQVGNDNSVNTISRNINRIKEKPLGDINNPRPEKSVSGNLLYINGWALNSSGINAVKIYVDNKWVGDAKIGLPRPDVANVHKQYEDSANSGYELTVDIGDMASGNKNIRVEQIGEDGTKQVLESSIKKENAKVLGDINEPRPGTGIKASSLYVKGWAVNVSGIKEVKMYVDGKFKGNANLGLARPDVENIYSDYTNATNSGYEANVDITDIAPGNRTVKIEQVANNGQINTMSTIINVSKQKPLGDINEPSMGRNTISDELYVRGWAVNSSKVKQVKIYVDGVFKANANLGLARPDVQNAFPDYPNAATSGYDAKINIAGIPSGTRIIKVEQIGFDETINTLSTSINVMEADPVGDINEPQINQKVLNNSLYVRGWAMNASGIERVEVYVDGQLKGNAKLGIARPDVVGVHPDYVGGAQSGYEATFDLTNLPAGTRGLKVVQIGKNGSKYTLDKNFVLEKKVAKIDINEPSINLVNNTDQLHVRGWALNDSGMSQVKIYIDDVFKGIANYGLDRPDVNNVHTGYINGAKSGFDLTVNTVGLSVGKHALKIEAIGIDGSVKTVSSIFYNKSKRLIVIDPGHNFVSGSPRGDLGASGTGTDGKLYIEQQLNKEVAAKLKVELERRGYGVVMTRQEDIAREELYTSLNRRVSIANNVGADMFVSIHHNSAAPDTTAGGVEVYYSSELATSTGILNANGTETKLGYKLMASSEKISRSSNLATSISKNISNATGLKNRGPKDDAFIVVKNTTMPSVLVECGFMSNPGELMFISNPATQQTIANAIADGIDSQM